MYENWEDLTHPGTDIKVTADREPPIIPKATNIQFDLWFALKKVSLLALRDVK